MDKNTLQHLSDNMLSFNYYLNNVVSNNNYKYSISSGYSIVQHLLGADGSVIKRPGYNDRYAIGNLLYFQHDTEFECSFKIDQSKLSKKRSNIKIYFENIDDFHSREVFKVMRMHLKLINAGSALHNKRNPAYEDIDSFEIFPLYVFNSLRQVIYQKIIIKFKSFKEFKDVYVIVKNNDESLSNAIKIIDNEFYIRYYSKLIEKKDKTEKLTKSEKQIVKMYYY